MSSKDWINASLLSGLRRGARPPRTPKKQRPKTGWYYDFTTVYAETRSEARALLKRELKLDRLPPGAQIARMGVDAAEGKDKPMALVAYGTVYEFKLTEKVDAQA